MSAAVVPIAGPLWALSERLEELLDTRDMTDTDELRAECDAEIARYIEAQLDKVDAIAEFLAHCESQAGMAAAEAKRLQGRKARYEARAEQVEQYVIRVMGARALRRLAGRLHTFGLAACPPSVQVLDEAAIPREYKRDKTETVVVKEKIREALLADIDVPGADLVIGKKRLARS